MARLFRFAFAVVLIVGLVFLALGYWAGSTGRTDERVPSATGTSGAGVDKAREVGADIGERVGKAGERIQQTANEASLTTKIKAKMALDDLVKASAIDVTTEGSTVVLTGRVATAAERSRAAQIARDTDGVRDVVDRLTVGR
jgi:hyperosmotically inducible protein